MSQLGRLFYVASDPATQHVAVINTNAASSLSQNASGLGPTGRGRVVSVTIRAVQNLIWEVYFWRTSAYNGAIGVGGYLGRAAFLVADGAQIAGAGLFHYQKNVDIPLADDEATGKIHYSLVNRSAASAGGANQIKIELAIDPTHGG